MRSDSTNLRPDLDIKVGFEGSTLFSKGYTGIPFYIKKLVEGFNDIESFSPNLFLPLKRRFKKRHLAPFTHNIPKSWYLKRTPFWNFTNVQIMHFTHAPFINISGVKKVATIHDLAFMADELKGAEIASSYFIEKRIHLLTQISQHADAIISVSQKTKDDFLKHFDFPQEKIHVVHLAPIFNPKSITQTQNSSKKPYLLCVGGICTRKNSLNILKGFLASKASKTHTLIFAGKSSYGSDPFHVFLNENKLENKVKIMGYVSDEKLQALYFHASGFVFPTLYEGFGIPILEAMNHKLPILIGSLGASAEIAGGHAHIAHPFDINSIASGIDALLDRDQIKLDDAFAYAQMFNWEKTINQTGKIYADLIK